MNYIKLFEEFTHKMFLFDNKNLDKKIPKNLGINYEGEKVNYEINSKIPGETKLEIYYNKPESHEPKLYGSIPPDYLLLKISIKSESIDYTYLNTRTVIYFEITDRNSPYINIKINEDGTCENILEKKLNLTDKTKNDIVKLIKTFDINIKTKDI